MRVDPVGDEAKPVIANLIQLYLYDMAALELFPVGSDGRYAYDFLDRFWQHPYLIHLNDDIAGFALVIDWCPITGRRLCFFMAEFFVMRPYRGRGIGGSAAAEIFSRHSGAWHVGVMERNRPAAAFWARALGDQSGLASSPVQFDNETWRLFALSAT